MALRSKSFTNQKQQVNVNSKNASNNIEANSDELILSGNQRKKSSARIYSSIEENPEKLSDSSKEGDELVSAIEKNPSVDFPSVNQWVLALFEEEGKKMLARVVGWKLYGTQVTHLTHLVDKKTRENKQNPLLKVISSSQESQKKEDYEFYVHFRGLNRRLDRWVKGKDIQLSFYIEELNDPVLFERFQKQGIKFISLLGVSNSANKSGNRSKKRNIGILDISDGEDPDEHEGMDHSAILDHEETTRLRTIGRVRIGKFILDTWYFSPLPDEYQNVDTLHFCEYCLDFFCFEDELIKHLSRCQLRHPPGNEIYRKDSISVFEIDGALTRGYAENLCYLAKLFLDHKTLQYDVEPFLFYIVTEVDEEGCHIVGYFSKEKVSLLHYNLACILTLPCYQRKGYGKLLVDLSYKLSLKEGKWGHPERPLSDLGRAIYNNWWAHRISEFLLDYFQQNKICERGSSKYYTQVRNYGKFIDNIVRSTGIRREDVVRILEENGIMRNIKDQYYIFCNKDFLKSIIKRSGKPGITLIDKNFNWVPYSRAPPSEIESLPQE
ncbi:histone acetyltransferase [Cryptosporidium ubiquitum]|uniref:Histone acetyltransferase n=1 Tax=Cryptosporidium ubiquitum TaxID=857276 RepID=A0A1J4MG19_9CRYT|nr:histone acetyltransferase [Cryptosporidium ubiquitum]OII73153.1 histone acetyltransferase [Cryptosporidium ubiquitum]